MNVYLSHFKKLFFDKITSRQKKCVFGLNQCTDFNQRIEMSAYL